MRLVFNVATEWCADGEIFDGGIHEIEDASADLVRLASHAHAAGALEVSEGLDLSTVQSQEDAEAALKIAMGEHVVERLPDGTSRSYWTGPWQEGQDAWAASRAAEGLAPGELPVVADIEGEVAE